MTTADRPGPVPDPADDRPVQVRVDPARREGAVDGPVVDSADERPVQVRADPARREGAVDGPVVDSADERPVQVRVDPARREGAVDGPVVVLVGVPGAGKSTVGRALAQRLAVGFRDTDADVEASAGRSIPDIFVQSGEAAFRALEAQAVRDALRDHPGVLALGGGAVLDPATRDRLADRRVVWLRVGVPAAAQRVGLSAPRPVLLGNVRGQLKTLMEQRAPLYAEVASVTVDTDELDPDAAVGVIVDALGLEGRLR